MEELIFLVGQGFAIGVLVNLTAWGIGQLLGFIKYMIQAGG